MNELSTLECYNYIKKIISFLNFKNSYQNKYICNPLFQKANCNMDFNYYGKNDINPIKILILKEQYNCIEKAFNVLPSSLREIIDLHLLQKKRFYDIADQLERTMLNIEKDYYLGLLILKYYYMYYYNIEKTIY